MFRWIIAWFKASKEQAKLDAIHRAAMKQAYDELERTRAALAPWRENKGADDPTPPTA